MELTSSLSSIQTAAEAGDPDALFELGNCHAYGTHTPINIRKALDLWMSAALQGHAEAVYCIGLCYALGTCVPHDTDTAVQMWFKAAASGCAKAMHALGICYLNGDGVPQSIPRAVMWLLLASTHSHPEAHAKLNELTLVISSEERKEGIRLMQEWMQTPAARTA